MMKLLVRAGAGVVAMGAVACGLLLTGSASAQCSAVPHMGKTAGLRNASWSPASKARMLRVDSEDGNGQNAIVGMWHFQFWAPDGTTEVDAGYQVWHTDGTEITNSGLRAPKTGDFCLGVWERLKDHTFQLNHFTTSYDPSGNFLVGTGNIKETVTVSPDGKTLSGTFSITQYDEQLNVVAAVSGTVKGTRVTVDSAPMTVH